LKILIQVNKEGKWFVASDLVTNVVDQGKTEKEAIANLKKGLEEHYELLMKLAPKRRKLALLDIEVEKYVKASGVV
jgi:predicted RNase H-like HicB family nuclease